MRVTIYTPKSIVVRDIPDKFLDVLGKMGGMYNEKLKNQDGTRFAGFIFPISRKEEIETWIREDSKKIKNKTTAEQEFSKESQQSEIVLLKKRVLLLEQRLEKLERQSYVSTTKQKTSEKETDDISSEDVSGNSGLFLKRKPKKEQLTETSEISDNLFLKRKKK
jgi:hypothetical protein